MTDQRQPMTLKGKEMLEAELKHLLQVERPAVIKAIEEARDHGDLSENADYDAAKEKQGFIEARTNEIKSKLAMADVIDPKSIKENRIVFGATVELEDLEDESLKTYQIVGVDESDVKNGKLSVFSPLSRALIGKKQGDIVEFNSPSGVREYEIISFTYK
ncbi:MAG: transcription elongation factor GreA [Bdellovibrionales bacterium]|nr:transcription elongation factor GreA [Bdellovibrionales bacterium]